MAPAKSVLKPSEYEAIQQLRKRIAARGIVEDWKLNNDKFLLRYLTSNRFDVSKAEKTIEAYTEFMEEYRVNELVQETFPREFSDKFSTYFGGWDHEGRPISMVEHGGLWNLKEVIQNGNENWFINYMFKMGAILEKRVVDSDSDYGILVCDMRGLAYGNFFHKRTLEVLLFLARTFEKVSPGLIGKVVIVNASKLLVTLVNTIQRIVALSSEVVIMDSNEEKWKARIRQLIPEEGISPHFGGVLKKVMKV